MIMKVMRLLANMVMVIHMNICCYLLLSLSIGPSGSLRTIWIDFNSLFVMRYGQRKHMWRKHVTILLGWECNPLVEQVLHSESLMLNPWHAQVFTWKVCIT